MPYRTDRKPKRNHKILVTLLSACAVIVWALAFSALSRAPGDPYRAQGPLAAVQSTEKRENTPSPSAAESRVLAASIMDLAEETEADQATVLPTDAPVSSGMPGLAPSATPSPVPTVRALAATATPGPATPTPTCTPVLLKIGSKGDEVTDLQKRLVDLGYLNKEPTGAYGKSTAAAVKDFQKCNGLDVDGIAGAITVRALFDDSAVCKPVATEKPRVQTGKSVAVTYVWITKNGECYHRTNHCGNTKHATKITLQEAIDRGYRPCGNCY